MPATNAPDSAFPAELLSIVKTVLVAGMGLLGAYLKKLFDERKARLLKKKQSDPLYLADKQLRLDQFTARTCVEVEADHVSVYKFHNGEHYAGGDSIQKMSMASEDVGSPIYARFLAQAQNLNCGLFPALMRGVGTQAVYWMHAGQSEDYAVNEAMALRGYETSAALVARGKGGQWLGMLVLSWQHRQDETVVPAARLAHLQTELGFLMNP